MWKSAVLILSLVTATSAIDRGAPVLPVARNLRVAERGDSNVTLVWDFKTPPDIDLRNVEFRLRVQSEGAPSQIFYPRFASEPFKYIIRDLFPKKDYVVELLATSPNWRDSPAAWLSFVTLPTDLPAPVIRSVESTAVDNFVKYSLRYNLPTPPLPVRRFEIRVCDSYCYEYFRNGTELTARVAVGFEANFSITVVACYDAGGAGLVRRESKPLLGKSGEALPWNPLETSASKVDNKIKLAWKPPQHPMGPTSYYEVFVCDLTLREFEQRSKDGDQRYLESEEAPHALTVGVHVLEFGKADEDGADSGSLISAQSAAPEPLLLVVLCRTSTTIRFRIVFRKPPMNSFNELDEFSHTRSLFLRTGIADDLDMPPFSTVRVRIRSCIIHDGTTMAACGSFTDLDLKSNVAGPSRVLDPGLDVKEHSLIITWKPPKEPRGPMDGYKVFIEERLRSKRRTLALTLERSKLDCAVKLFSNQKTYNIGIAAFNIDLENRSKLHVGEWTYIQPPTTFMFVIGPLVPILFFILILAICAPLTLLISITGENKVVPQAGGIPMRNFGDRRIIEELIDED